MNNIINNMKDVKAGYVMEDNNIQILYYADYAIHREQG